MAYSYADLKLEREGGVAIVTLDRPDVLNALSPAMRYSLVQAIDEVDRDDGIKAMIITGAGRGFCSGADVRATLGTASTRKGPVRPCDGRKGLLGPTPLPVQRLCRLDKPTIAAVNGVAAGAGLGIALACDMRIAAESARLISLFVRRGLTPDTGVTYFLPRLIGMSKALELMWSGDEVNAAESARLGLVSQVVPDAELMNVARERAERIAKGPSVAIELTKRLAYAGLDTSLSVHLAYEMNCSYACHATEDFEEGVRSFAEKRKPVFKGT
ncbi:MAG: enoyl-CoA hydratase/isomerase family protein [Chloroflexi bacterium]|nr:enoyl-CoA hydratase/isomerase family protein [Chloroflexota bacterium]